MNTIRNNKGVSVVEMLVVIGIIAIITSLAVISFSLVKNADVAKSADSFKASLTTARSRSMAKGDINGRLTFTRNGNVFSSTVGGSGDATILAKGGMKMYVAVKNPATDVLESMAGFAEVSGTSAYYFNTAGMLSYINDPANVADLGKVYMFAFRYNSNKRVSAVILYPATGKTETVMWYEP